MKIYTSKWIEEIKTEYGDVLEVLPTNESYVENSIVITNKAQLVPDIYNLVNLTLKKSSRLTFFDKGKEQLVDSGVYYIGKDISSLDSITAVQPFIFKDKVYPATAYTKALFLDRDGVINVDVGYPHKPKDLEFVDGVVDFLKDEKIACFKKLIITNQAGVAKGKFPIKQVEIFNTHLIKELQNAGVTIDDVEICPYHSDGVIAQYKCDSFLRKPNPGMLLELCTRHNVDLKKSYMIGDKPSDHLNFPILNYLHLQGEYDLSSARAPVAKDFTQLKDLVK